MVNLPKKPRILTKMKETRFRLLRHNLNWIFPKMFFVRLSVLIHLHIGRQQILALCVKMFHFLHGWLHWQKSGA